MKNASSATEKVKVNERMGQRHLSVVECDLHELPLFHADDKRFIHPVNMEQYVPEQWAVQGERTWLGEDMTKAYPQAFEDANRIVMDGWPRGVERVKALADKLRRQLPPPESARRKPKWGDEGDDLDRDKLMTGQLDTMWRTTTRVKRRAPRVVRLAFSWGMSCFGTAEQIANSAASLQVLADLLETADYQTEIILCGAASHYDYVRSEYWNSASIVNLKHAGDALNPNAVAIAGHAGVFRTLGFCMITAHDRKVDTGLGSPLELKNIWKQLEAQKLALPVDAILERSTTMAQAEKAVVKAMRDILGPDYAREAGYPDDIELETADAW